MDTTILDDKKRSLSINYTPTYEQLIIHPEEGETFKINTSLKNIYEDMHQIDSLLINQTYSLDYLMKTTIDRLETINDNILAEQERLQDIKMLCNKYTDFDNVIPITQDKAISGVYSYSNNSFCCKISNYKKQRATVLNITGNGIEGNKYVYKDGEYVKDSIDTSNRKNIIDNSIKSYYEYERITASATEPYLLSDFNLDSEAAKYTITFQVAKDINLITIKSDDTTVNVVGVQYSYDNIDYIPLDIPNIIINNKQYCYDNSDYICGDNKIVVPSCKFVKITFQSVGTTDDIIAYDRVMFSHEDVHKTLEDLNVNYIPTTTTRATYNDLKHATIIVNAAKRHAIKINDITLSSNTYNSHSYFSTDNLISGESKYSIAVFANVYIPSKLKDNSVEFVLTVNGEDYDVIPINVVGSGKKILRYSQGKSKTEYTEILSEPIKSAYLTVKMTGKADLTPFVGNIKKLLGGEI